MDNKVFLKQNVKMEPLWNQWYAWPFLLQPIVAGCITAKLHLRILDSYIQAPHLHQAASRNPAMRGGPFMDYAGGIEKVTALIQKTRTELARLLDLSSAVSYMNNLLENEANGFSLESLYDKIPEILRGYVELGYDLNNHASIRLIEPLLYMGQFYKPELQSVSLSFINNDERPFVLSTPRLKMHNELHLNIPFNDPLIDKLFKMRFEGGTWEVFDEMVQRFSLNKDEIKLLQSFFTIEQPHLPTSSLDNSDIKIRYFGHATILIETKDIAIITDPLISYKFDGASERYTFEDLPEKIDYVVLTHSHQDHVMLETLLQIRHKVKTVICPRNAGGTLQDPSLKLVLKALGFNNVIELDEMEELPVVGGRIVGIPFFGEHGDLHIHSKLAFFIQLKDKKILCAADSNNIEPKMYEHVRNFIGQIDHIFIGMECAGAPMSWLYGPLFNKPIDRKMDQDRRLNGSNCLRATGIVECFNPKNVYVYAMGMEPWLSFISSISYTETSVPIVESNAFIAQCKGKGIFAQRLNSFEEVNL